MCFLPVFWALLTASQNKIRAKTNEGDILIIQKNGWVKKKFER
jgi:hypothetical protein